MPTDAPEIDFRPVTPDAYPMLRRWLTNPPMNEWWGEPEKALNHIRDMVEGREPVTRPFIFQVDGAPAGYIQSWTVGDEIDGGGEQEAPWLSELPRKAVGVDLSLGEPAFLGKGTGTAVLRAFLMRLFAEGCEMACIDPDESNARAIRAYEKVGFRLHGRYPHGGSVTILMTITPERLTEATS